MIRLQGSTVNPGLAVSPAFLVQEDTTSHPKKSYSKKQHGLNAKDIFEKETERYKKACQSVALLLEDTVSSAEEHLGHEAAQIFEAQLLFLEDEMFSEFFFQKLKLKGMLAEQALQKTIQHFEKLFLSMKNPHFRHRLVDFQDVWHQVLSFLKHGKGKTFFSIKKPVILVARHLYPSTIARLDPSFIRGLVTEFGGETSHVAILARSLEIPYILGVENILDSVKQDQFVILDGDEQCIYLNPDDETKQLYVAKLKEWEEKQKVRASYSLLPAQTACGEKIVLRANAHSLQSFQKISSSGADGIGLFRTEFLFMNKATLPNEEEQYTIYRNALEEMSPKPVTFRLLDIGSDKQIPSLPLPEESLSHLGWRGSRILLQKKALFRTQVRALWRASAHGHLRVLLPFITTLEEAKCLLKWIEDIRNEMSPSPSSDQMQLGMMIETPAAAICFERFVNYFEFFSIGTNDLLQLIMASDRNNARVRHLLTPTQPSFLLLMKQIQDTAKQLNVSMSICGEVAGDVRYLPLLMGLGFRELSVSCQKIHTFKHYLQQFRMCEFKSLAEKSLASSSLQISKLLASFSVF